jgi:PAS domain S-box-containing protein
VSQLLESVLGNPARLTALERRGLLDSPPDEALDRLTRLAAGLLRAPVALVSLVDDHRQFFKSAVGLPEPWASRREAPLSHSLCQHVVAAAAPLRVDDAPQHPIGRDNLAVAELGVVAYLGMPLISADGHALGSFCVIDSQARTWAEDEIAVLRDLAAAVMTEIELRTVVREAEAAARAAALAQQRYQDLVDSVGAIVWEADPATFQFTFINKRVEDVLGYPVERWLHERHFWADHIHPEDRDWAVNYCVDCTAAREDHQFEYRILSADGRVVWLRDIVKVILDEYGRPAHLRGVMIDVTERRQAEQRRAVQFAVTAVLASADSIAEASAGILQAVCGSLGWACGGLWLVDAAAGVLRCAEVWSAPTADVADFVAASRARTFLPGVGLPGHVWASGQALWVPDVLQRANFPRGPIAARVGLHAGFAYPIRLGDELLGVMEFFSQAIQAPDAPLLEMLTATGSQLAQFIVRKQAEAERAALLERERAAREAAEAAVRQRNGFLAIVSHDLKNPLATVKGRAQLLQRRLRGRPDRAADLAALASVEEQADAMRRLLDQLVDLSRVQGGHELPLRRTAVDLTALVAQCVEHCRATTDRHDFVVQDPAGGPLVGQWDRDRLAQVVGNLLGNAVKYSPAGGRVTVTLARETADGQEWARLAVADEGIGILAADLARVFEPFHRGANVPENVAGTGIGLAGSRQIVEQHGGRIVAASEEGAGSTFALWLPLTSAER